MNTKKRAVIVLALAMSALTVAGPAAAEVWSYYYNVTMPWGQQPRNTGVQDKWTSYKAGTISANSISGGYNIDAQMCSLSGLYCDGGTKIHNIPANHATYSLPNTYVAGPNRAINIQPSTWNFGNVTAIGYSSVQ